jgi:hypothetical protein
VTPAWWRSTPPLFESNTTRWRCGVAATCPYRLRHHRTVRPHLNKRVVE